MSNVGVIAGIDRSSSSVIVNGVVDQSGDARGPIGRARSRGCRRRAAPGTGRSCTARAGGGPGRSPASRGWRGCGRRSPYGSSLPGKYPARSPQIIHGTELASPAVSDVPPPPSAPPPSPPSPAPPPPPSSLTPPPHVPASPAPPPGYVAYGSSPTPLASLRRVRGLSIAIIALTTVAAIATVLTTILTAAVADDARRLPRR